MVEEWGQIYKWIKDYSCFHSSEIYSLLRYDVGSFWSFGDRWRELKMLRIRAV